MKFGTEHVRNRHVGAGHRVLRAGNRIAGEGWEIKLTIRGERAILDRGADFKRPTGQHARGDQIVLVRVAQQVKACQSGVHVVDVYNLARDRDTRASQMAGRCCRYPRAKRTQPPFL